MNNSSFPFEPSTRWKIGRCDFSDVESRFDAFLYLSIAIIALFENITISVCYFRYRPLRNATNLCLISLTASDILVATLSIPLTFAVYLCKLRPSIDKRHIGDFIYLICDMLPSILSIYSLSLVAIDRMVAVTSPYTYAKYVTQKSAMISVATMWIFVTFLVSLILVFKRYQFTLFIVFMSYIIPVTIMVISFSIIGYIAKKHAKAINEWDKIGYRLKKESRTFTYNGDTFPSAENELKQHRISSHGLITELSIEDEEEWHAENKKNYLWRELKAAFRLLLLLSVFIVAWTPFMALNIEHYRCHNCHIDVRLLKYFKMLHYLNSALNPLLYICLNKRWRAAFLMAVCHPMSNSRASENTITTSRDWS